MKKFSILLAACLLLLAPLSLIAQKEGYNIKVEVKGVQDTTAYLAYYFGDKLYYQDTAQIDHKGKMTFAGEEDLTGGMYAVVLPGSRFFDIIVNEPVIELKTDTHDFSYNMRVAKSKENEVFFGYVQYLENMKRRALKLRDERKTADDLRKAAIAIEMGSLDSVVNQYQLNLIKDNPDLLVSKIVKMSRDIKVPKTINQEKDSYAYYLYYRDHYFDNIDLQDDRTVRTPVFHNKLDYYFKKMYLQQPDTLAKAGHKLIAQLKEGSEMFKYIVHYLTYGAESSEIMGMDALFVEMVDKYYRTGKAYWMTEDGLKKVFERASALKPLLVGKAVPQLYLLDTSETKRISLYAQQSKFTVLIFWDPNCGHCKEEIPKLQKVYAKYDRETLKVYSVGTPLENNDFRKYIKEHKLDWINVSDSPDQPSLFRADYDIKSSPTVFVLDKDKKIIAKRIDVDQIEGLLNHILEQEANSGEKGGDKM